ncbi:MAG TPA: glycosyltransferase, partial [Usitatibacter sp.]|nr:glycosyltransferase [Usitatibacter sp.]
MRISLVTDAWHPQVNGVVVTLSNTVKWLERWGHEVRVLLSTWGSRGDVQPVLGLAVQLRNLGVRVRLCAPPDFAEMAARVGVEMVPAGQSVRAVV